MELKNRQTRILRRMYESSSEIDSEILQKELNIAKRTFYYDLERINGWLTDNALHPLVTGGGKIKLKPEDRKKIAALLKKQSNYLFSSEERQSMIVLLIMISSQPVTINYLQSVLDISKNTLLKGIKAIREEVASHELNLAYSPKMGYSIEGEETAARKVVWKQLHKMARHEGFFMIRNLLQFSLVELTRNEIDFYELCRCMIKQYERDLQISCFLGDDGYESMMIQVAWIRSIKGFTPVMTDEEKFILMNTPPFQSLRQNIRKMNLQGIQFPEEEIFYITSIFLGIESTEFLAPKEEDRYISNLVSDFVKTFKCIACINIAEPERLCNKLVHHIRPLFYRVKYGEQNQNLLLKDIKRMYPAAFDFTRRTIEKITRLNITEDEIAGICVYLIGCLGEKNIQQNEEDRPKIIIFGTGNMTEALLAKEQIQERFGFESECVIRPKDQIRKTDLKEYAAALLVGETSDRHRAQDLIVIDSIVTEESLNKIAIRLKEQTKKSRYDSVINGVIRILNKAVPEGFVDESIESKVYFDLFKYFNELDLGKGSLAQPERPDLFSEKLQAISVPKEFGWIQAVLVGSEHLQRDSENSHLVERMWNLHRHELLQFYRISDKVVLIHCPMHGEKDGKIDVQLLKSEQGIECPDDEKANLLICLSTINQYAHWSYLFEIYNYFGKEENTAKFLEESSQ